MLVRPDSSSIFGQGYEDLVGLKPHGQSVPKPKLKVRIWDLGAGTWYFDLCILRSRAGLESQMKKRLSRQRHANYIFCSGLLRHEAQPKKKPPEMTWVPVLGWHPLAPQSPQAFFTYDATTKLVSYILHSNLLGIVALYIRIYTE